MSGDSPYYYALADNLVNGKGYWLSRSGIYPDAIRDINWDSDPNAAITRDYAFRMPGYALFLAPAVGYFGLDGGLNFIVLLQLIFSAISAYLLAHLIYMLTKSKAAFAAFLAIYLLSAYVSKFAFYIMSESMSISLLIILLYFTYVASRREQISPFVYLGMGVLMTLAIFMRPFFIPFFALMGLWLAINLWVKPKGVLALALFVAPFVVGESAWIVRNYQNTGKFIPLETSSQYAETVNEAFQEWNHFVVVWGENWLFWEANSMSAWILPDYFFAQGNQPVTDEVLPQWLKDDSKKMEELYQLKADYKTLLDRDIPLEERLVIQEKCVVYIGDLVEEVKERFPMRYYLTGRLNIFYQFMSERIDMSYRTIIAPANIFYSFAGPALNSFVQYFCFFMILFLLLVYRSALLELDTILLIIFFIPLFVAGMFSLVYGMADSRHLSYAYPFLLFGGIYSVYDFYIRSKVFGWILIVIASIIAISSGLYTLLHYLKW